MICKYPYWFLGLIPLFLHLGLMLHQIRQRNRQRQTIFFTPARSGVKRRALLLSLTLTLLLTALAEPIIYQQKPVFKRSRIDMVIGIDISKSMLAEDSVFPGKTSTSTTLNNRLNRARIMVLDLLDNLAGERIGVFVFSAESYELVPLTTDYGYCRYLVENLDELAISTPGSNLAAGLQTGVEILTRTPADTTGIILLISDGENSADNSAALEKIVLEAGADHRRIYSIGVGRQAAASLIPIRTPDGSRIIGYYENEKGDLLTTSLEPENLKKLAAAGRGRYWFLGREQLAPVIMKKILLDLHRSGLSSVTEKQPYTISSWLLALAVVTFLLTL